MERLVHLTPVLGKLIEIAQKANNFLKPQKNDIASGETHSQIYKEFFKDVIK